MESRIENSGKHTEKECSHFIQENILSMEALIKMGIKLDNTCSDCKIGGEVWLCLKCGEINCSRFVNGHMAMHNEVNK
jgi:uncharacterized UBP type Zn finger protein